MCTQVVHKPHPDPDSSVKIQNPSEPPEPLATARPASPLSCRSCVLCACSSPVILKVVATLLKSSAPSAALMEVRRLFLSDMIKLFSNSRENRR